MYYRNLGRQYIGLQSNRKLFLTKKKSTANFNEISQTKMRRRTKQMWLANKRKIEKIKIIRLSKKQKMSTRKNGKVKRIVAVSQL